MRTDLLGLAAVIAACGTSFGVIGGVFIQLKTLKLTKTVSEQNEVIHKAVNSNHQAALEEIKQLHAEAEEKAKEKADDDLARSENKNVNNS